MLWFLSVVVSGALLLAPPSDPTSSDDARRLGDRGRLDRRDPALLTAADRRVRTTDPKIHKLLEEGVRRSSTFGSLVAELNATDVIVYIESVKDLPLSVAGQLLLVPMANYQRYLRIQIAPHGSTNEHIATIGHELCHALEIAAAPEVRDQSGLIHLYRRIGRMGVGVHSFDTLAAQHTGRKVKNELGG
jgi:hypothetical protein